MSAASLAFTLRAVGATHLALGAAHVLHTFFIAFVVMAFGALAFGIPSYSPRRAISRASCSARRSSSGWCIELRRARDLLLAPIPMVAANAVLLSLAWYAALGR